MRAARVGSLVLAAVALAPATAGASRIVYVNTDPVTVTAGAHDPTVDQFSFPNLNADLDGWVGATPEQIEELLVVLEDTSVAFDIVYTLERPAAGPYDMVVFGTADDYTGSAIGEALGGCTGAFGIVDCGDMGGVSIGFNFFGCLAVEEQFDPHRVAFETLAALGASWGLENIAGTGQIMSDYSANGLRFGDMCADIDGGGNCLHVGCGMGQQNSSADLLATLGARVDDGPPVLTVLEPQPNADVTSPFNVVIDIDDAFGGLSATLEVVDSGLPVMLDTSWPHGWNDVALEAGLQVLHITAVDADGNEIVAHFPICVDGSCSDMGDGDGDGDGEMGDGEMGDDDGGEPGGTSGFDAGLDRGTPPCSIVHTREPGATGALLMLLGFGGLLRYRRPH